MVDFVVLILNLDKKHWDRRDMLGLGNGGTEGRSLSPEVNMRLCITQGCSLLWGLGVVFPPKAPVRKSRSSGGTIERWWQNL